MKSVAEMTQVELSAFVQSNLSEKGIDIVLSGGAAVALYTSGKYVSQDIDLVNRYSIRRTVMRAAMAELGFQKEGKHFVHPDSQFFVEFPPGPLGFGEQLGARIDEIEMSTGILRIISPIDCVKDRLAWYYHDGDRQCLSQAVLVSGGHPIDIDEIRKWSEGEGKLEEFEEIRSQLAEA